MMEHNPIPARQVIIHGDCWPVTTTVVHLVRSVLPGCECEATYTLPVLLQQLSRKPEAALILCLRPREHLFLFYALKQALLNHPALVISDELFFSDRLVLKVYGDIPVQQQQELTALLTRVQQREQWPGGVRPRITGKLTDFLSSPAPATGFSEVPLIFTSPRRLMNYMALLMHREMLALGVSPAQQRLLEEVYRGRERLSGLSGRLNVGEKKIWQDKYRLLVKMGMRNRMRELLSGTRFCESLQRTPFIAPENADEGGNGKA
ncbi:transcriptional regulator [Salmonella enterica]|nr:transcriptional regulator [Salmonella enterica]EGQ2011196.1 transcriptional regulator [Salmonella enterica subsp. enterica serovar Infantis]EKL0024038.1 transcriptional regulator [Salmonella enterica]